MPPKGKKKGKKKENPKQENSNEDEKEHVTSEKEILLQNEYDELKLKLEMMKVRITDLHDQTNFLQDESKRVRIESHEYMSYLEKMTDKRQTTVVTLSDFNAKELEKLRNEKEKMLKDFDDKKLGLQRLLLEKENALAKAEEQIEQLKEYKDLHGEQLAKLKELEAKSFQLRGEHSRAFQDLKMQLRQEKMDFQNGAKQRVQEMACLANKEAVAGLTDYISKIRKENEDLRKKVNNLINNNDILQSHKEKLCNQKSSLLKELKYVEDLHNLRKQNTQKEICEGQRQHPEE